MRPPLLHSLASQTHSHGSVIKNMSHMSLSKQTDILRAIKALRRSIKGEEKAKAHVSIGPKSAVAIVPPKKVR